MEAFGDLDDGTGAFNRVIAFGLIGLVLWSMVLAVPEERAVSGAVSADADRVALGAISSAVEPSSPTSVSNSWEIPVQLPYASYEYAMAYDVESDRVILVGITQSGRLAAWAYDSASVSWTEVTSASIPVQMFYGPSGAPSVGLTYDEESDRIVLASHVYSGNPESIGGSPPWQWNLETWSYDFNTNTWANLTPVGGPPSGFFGTMAYDLESDLAIMFGWHATPSGYPPLAETWAFDLNANAWSNLTTPSGLPAGLGSSRTAYHSVADRVIVWGREGEERDAPVGTWAYDYNSNGWTEMNPASEPSPRGGHALAYDAESNRIILFGGSSEAFGDYNDTWSYDFDRNVWTNMSPVGWPSGALGWSGAGRSGHAMAYASRLDLVILFGGWGWSDTWGYDYNRNEWTNMLPVPSRFHSGQMVYDSESDRILLISDFGSTWAYDSELKTWRDMKATPAPAFSHNLGYAYDRESDRVITYGQHADPEGNLVSDTWAYDFNTNTWTDMMPASVPTVLDPGGFAVAYDSESDRILLVGHHFCRVETWSYDFNTNTWIDLSGPPGPSARFLFQVAYDSQSDRVILFGGGDTPNQRCSARALADTWAYDYNSNTWTNMTTPAGPDPRHGHSMAYDGSHDRVLLVGGSLDYGSYYDDTWAYDFDTNSWTNMSPSASPGLRWGAALAYDSESRLAVLFGGADVGVSVPGPLWYRFPDPLPSSPRSLQATEGNGRVTLTWEPPPSDGGQPITGYRTYRFTWPEGLSILATVGQVLSYTDETVTNGVLYYYWVSAINVIGEGPLSETVAATPRLTLSAPSNLQAGASNGQVILEWQAPLTSDDSPVTGFRIYRGVAMSFLSVVATLSPVLVYEDWNVTNGVTYYYRISAMSGLDEGPRSNVTVATPREYTKPSVSIHSPVDGSTTGSAVVTVTGIASDDTAIHRVELSRDRIEWVEATGTASSEGTVWSGILRLEEGRNTIYAQATDTSGNTETATVVVTVLNPFVAALSSPIVIAAGAAGVALVVAAILTRRRRDRRWERE